MEREAVGFVGLGLMGASMAERLMAAGIPLVACDLNPDNVAPFAKAGATIVDTPRAVADRAKVVFSCLPNMAVSLAVALEPEGLRDGKAMEVYVDCGTIGPDVAVEIAAFLPEHVGFLDAPVSGGPNGARAGTLTAIVSGPTPAFEMAGPYLAVMAKNVYRVGDSAGQAQLAKLINNHLSAAARVATFEGLVFGLKAGLDPDVLLDVINNSTGFNHATKSKIPMAVQSGEFAYGARLKNSVKDETLLAEEAAKLDVPLWIAPKLLETLKGAADAGYLDQDSMFLMQYMGEKAGIDARALMEGDRQVNKTPGESRDS